MDLLERRAGALVVPELVVAEVSCLLGKRIGPHAEIALVRSLDVGELYAEPVEQRDWSRIRELLSEYEDFGLGTVDASVIAACERLDVTELATLDHRHFSVVRPRHCEALSLLPG